MNPFCDECGESLTRHERAGDDHICKRCRASANHTAEAVAIEREATVGWHEGQLAALGVRWDQFSTLGMTSAANAALDKAAVHKEAI